MTLTEARKYAKTYYGREFGKLTVTKDSQGEYTVWENDHDTFFTHWVEGEGAAEAKVAYIMYTIRR